MNHDQELGQETIYTSHLFRDPRQSATKETAVAGPSRRRDGFRRWIMEYLKKLVVTFLSPTMMILLVAGETTDTQTYSTTKAPF